MGSKGEETSELDFLQGAKSNKRGGASALLPGLYTLPICNGSVMPNAPPAQGGGPGTPSARVTGHVSGARSAP